jgi:pimeloyl-ACP methyl ester carboxylesterase|tara:strand:+ start:448 stop:675 length:228 start_codon:yes stop_codon:yes gene_type:complete
VIEYIYENKRVSSIGLWGRSMGAATALLYQAANPGSVNVMALDSGFSSLNDVIGSMAGNMGVPPEFVQMMFPMIE